MNSKEYLKLNQKKFAIAALLFILFVPLMVYDNGWRCIRAPCPSDNTGSLLMFALLAPTHTIIKYSASMRLPGLLLPIWLPARLCNGKHNSRQRGKSSRSH